MPPARTAAAGSRRAARSQPRRPPRRARGDAPLRIRWDKVGRVLLLVVLAVVLGLYVQEAIAYLSVRSEANQQAAIAHRLARENARLAQEQRSLNDPATIRRDARGLGMVLPGERPYAMMRSAGR
jgi:cell division protein FtsB